jgi:hypothetical protein
VSRQARDNTFNSLEVKGVAEIALAGVAPAVANAVYDATARPGRHLPITGSDCWWCREAAGRGSDKRTGSPTLYVRGPS